MRPTFSVFFLSCTRICRPPHLRGSRYTRARQSRASRFPNLRSSPMSKFYTRTIYTLSALLLYVLLGGPQMAMAWTPQQQTQTVAANMSREGLPDAPSAAQQTTQQQQSTDQQQTTT